MRGLIDTMFSPVLGWLYSIVSAIQSVIVPAARPFSLSDYFGYFDFLGPAWKTFITTVCTLGFIYLLIFFIMSNIGLFRKFKDILFRWV